MSRPAALAPAALALAALVASTATFGEVYGQQTEGDASQSVGEATARPSARYESPEALRARLDSLRPLLEQARADLEARNARADDAARVAAAAEARVDTLRVGPATVLTPADQSERTRELFEEVWQESFAHLGHSPALARSVIVFQWTDEPVPIHVAGQARELTLDEWTRRSRVEEAIAGTLAAAMLHDLREERTNVGAWVMGSPLRPASMERVYRIVATTHSRVTRDCLAGDGRACASAMGLGPAAPDPGERAGVEQLREWYTPGELRSLVASTLSPRHRELGDLRRGCVDESDIAVCERLLVGFYFREWSPLGAEVRPTLLAYALERGGEGAWSRLIERPDMTPVEAMEHASGMPMPELVSGWRERLVAHRPDSYEGLIPRSGMTLVWTLFFAALALRSTRWRLG